MLSLSEDSISRIYLVMLILFVLQNIIPNYLQQLCDVAKLQAILKLYLGHEIFSLGLIFGEIWATFSNDWLLI